MVLTSLTIVDVKQNKGANAEGSNEPPAQTQALSLEDRIENQTYEVIQATLFIVIPDPGQ